MKISHIVASFFLFCAILFGVKLFKTEKTKDENCLIVGTSFDYPPYTFMQQNTIVGFDIDLIELVAQRLHKKIKIVGLPFEGLVFSLLAGEIDLIASAMSPTPRRAKFVRFTKPYLDSDQLIILSKKKFGAVEGVQSLLGKTVVVNTGFVADTYMSGKAGIDLIRLKTPADALMALSSGRVDAWVCAQSSAKTLLSKLHNRAEYQETVLQDTGDDYAFVVQKNNDSLANQINDVLAQLHQDGVIEQLKTKWEIL